MANIKIEANGTFGKIFVDGQEVRGVRKASYELSIDNKAPVLKLELVATDMTIDSNGVIPELPDVFKPFYKRIEPTE